MYSINANPSSIIQSSVITSPTVIWNYNATLIKFHIQESKESRMHQPTALRRKRRRDVFSRDEKKQQQQQSAAQYKYTSGCKYILSHAEGCCSALIQNYIFNPRQSLGLAGTKSARERERESQVWSSRSWRREGLVGKCIYLVSVCIYVCAGARSPRITKWKTAERRALVVVGASDAAFENCSFRADSLSLAIKSRGLTEHLLFCVKRNFSFFIDAHRLTTLR